MVVCNGPAEPIPNRECVEPQSYVLGPSPCATSGAVHWAWDRALALEPCVESGLDSTLTQSWHTAPEAVHRVSPNMWLQSLCTVLGLAHTAPENNAWSRTWYVAQDPAWYWTWSAGSDPASGSRASVQGQTRCLTLDPMQPGNLWAQPMCRAGSSLQSTLDFLGAATYYINWSCFFQATLQN